MTLAHTDTTNTLKTRELRKFTRFDLQIPASIRLQDGYKYDGRTNNISGNGAFFVHNEASNIQMDTQCTLTLFVEGKMHSEEIKFHCVVKDDRKGGFGLEFKTMPTNDFINFIFLLSRKHPEPDKFISQITVEPGVKLLEEQ